MYNNVSKLPYFISRSLFMFIFEINTAVAMNNKPNMRILLTDDDEDDREFFAEAIVDLHLNYPVEFCKNGIELIDRLSDLNSDIPDIIFLDLNMPLLSGLETLQQIREDTKFKHIPVIAIYSTSSTEEGIKDTYSLGANAYIVKPIEFNDLKKILKKVIETNWEEKLKKEAMDSFIISL
ncbi:response regulator [Flavobacterium sp. Fl-77]|uniref:Response regulator n=1 Tax=Flavobacterium flavipigmentatum TaxID=2893884 RepID=A0AAJ2SF15_9FLAO|nr:MULTISPECIES: response regulator [unclassified Flavobacterium]MDX6183644.1 response regulator [Flavobacterium sp. Fl-33]MDX6187196.1 response regulator [Flavobacterium sp. Fl-77]UFH37994.1 response regulator [Flavobacterium sp. F-70]